MFVGTRLGKWIFATARRAGAAMGVWQDGLRCKSRRQRNSLTKKKSEWVGDEERIAAANETREGHSDEEKDEEGEDVSCGVCCGLL